MWNLQRSILFILALAPLVAAGQSAPGHQWKANLSGLASQRLGLAWHIPVRQKHGLEIQVVHRLPDSSVPEFRNGKWTSSYASRTLKQISTLNDETILVSEGLFGTGRPLPAFDPSEVDNSLSGVWQWTLAHRFWSPAPLRKTFFFIQESVGYTSFVRYNGVQHTSELARESNYWQVSSTGAPIWIVEEITFLQDERTMLAKRKHLTSLSLSAGIAWVGASGWTLEVQVRGTRNFGDTLGSESPVFLQKYFGSLFVHAGYSLSRKDVSGQLSAD